MRSAKPAVILLCACCATGCALGEQVSENDLIVLSNAYHRVLAVVEREGTVHTSARLIRDRVSIERARYTTTVSTMFPSSFPVHVVVERGTGRVYAMGNKAVKELARTSGPQPLPSLSVDEAIGKARSYLSELKLGVPPGARLRRATYFRLSASWSVVWERRTNGYAYFDPQSGNDAETIGVRFHERHGFDSYWSGICLPSPSNLPVHVVAEDAARLAAPYGPKIVETPFFRSIYGRDFKIDGLLGADLKIVAPNWLADPSRAVVIRDTSRPEELPKYTRLAWVVTLKTASTNVAIKHAGPDIYVYVDAGTGEMLGGSFS